MDINTYHSMSDPEKKRLLSYLAGSQSSLDVKSRLGKVSNIPDNEIDDSLAMYLYSQLLNSNTGSMGATNGLQQHPQESQGALSQYTDPVAKTIKANMSGSTGDNIFGEGGQLGGGWMPAIGGALAGYMSGKKFSDQNPDIGSEDGFGQHHKDLRTQIGGTALGGTMGYFGGPIGAALAGPTTDLINPMAEKFSRNVINKTNDIGGPGLSFMFDPAGTAASGKFSWGDMLKPPFIGKWF